MMTSCIRIGKETVSETKILTAESVKKVIVARVKVKEGKEAAFVAIAQPLIEATHKEPGNLFYELYQSPFDSKQFIFYEEYKDQAAFDAHAASNAFKTFSDALGEVIDGELEVGQF